MPDVPNVPTRRVLLGCEKVHLVSCVFRVFNGANHCGGMVTERERAVRDVRGMLHSMQPGGALPADSALASQLGLSVSTLRRAMQELAEDGSVVRVHGRGTCKSGGPRRAPQPSANAVGHPDAVQSVVENIKSCIARGELRRGDPLPPYKNLCTGFQLSASTVSKAYRELVRSGLVCKVGRSHRVGRFLEVARVPLRREIVFFCPSSLELDRLFENEEIALSLNKAESELIAHGHTVAFDSYENLEEQVAQWIRRGRFPQGIVLAGHQVGGIGDGLYQSIGPHVERLIAAAGSLRPQVLALTLNFILPNSPIRFFSVSHATTAMMRRLARFLFEKSTPRVTFYFDARTERIGLLQDALRLVAELDHLLPHSPLRYAIIDGDETGRADTFQSVFQKRYPDSTLESRASKYRPIRGADVRKAFRFYSSAEEAFTESGRPGAWIYWHDELAVEALQWCRHERLRVPKDVSVVSLENNRRFYRHGITTCVRDWETMGYLMAHALMNDIPLEYTRRGFIQCDALMLERQTT